MEHQPFTIAQMRPIRDCMTVSRPANLGKEVPVTWFSLGAGTTITPESYDCTTLYVGAMGNGRFILGEDGRAVPFAGAAVDSGEEAFDQHAGAYFDPVQPGEAGDVEFLL